jgi:hypothetical protein
MSRFVDGEVLLTSLDNTEVKVKLPVIRWPDFKEDASNSFARIRSLKLHSFRDSGQ